MKAKKRTGPTVRRGKSPGTYRTPSPFLEAVRLRFGRIAIDLAASETNKVAPVFFDRRRNALRRDWTELRGTAFCNPPFDPLKPWAEKCAEARHRAGWTLLLAPASVGTEWFAEHVHGKALVLTLRPRLVFFGRDNPDEEPYPKDLMLACYGFGVSGLEPWRWDSYLTTSATP